MRRADQVLVLGHRPARAGTSLRRTVHILTTRGRGKMKNLMTKLAGMALAVGLAATGAAQAGKIDEIRERGTVRIGVSLGGEPIGFRDDQNNPVGYDVDVATMLAEKLGVPVEFVDVSGDAASRCWFRARSTSRLPTLRRRSSAPSRSISRSPTTAPACASSSRRMPASPRWKASPARRSSSAAARRARPSSRTRHLRPSSSTPTTSRRKACCFFSRSVSMRPSRTPRCSTISPPRTKTW
ncbi:protein of unknown function [Aminobacter niigataensis]|nr:protein of unknown function [Aminobacter niigataensis]